MRNKKYDWCMIGGAILMAAYVIWNLFSAWEIMQIRQLRATTEGRVIYNRFDSALRVAYKIDGQQFTQSIFRFERSTGMRRYITLYYDPANPYRVTSGRIAVGHMAISCFIVIALIAVFIVAKSRKRKKNRRT